MGQVILIFSRNTVPLVLSVVNLYLSTIVTIGLAEHLSILVHRYCYNYQGMNERLFHNLRKQLKVQVDYHKFGLSLKSSILPTFIFFISGPMSPIVDPAYSANYCAYSISSEDIDGISSSSSLANSTYISWTTIFEQEFKSRLRLFINYLIPF